MKNKEEIVPKFKCEICGKKFNEGRTLDIHDMEHNVRPVSKVPLTVILRLPDGITQGKWAAAEAFSDCIRELREMYPGRRFQYVPFRYECDSLTAILAIANPNDD